jgi:hypothetical protein
MVRSRPKRDNEERFSLGGAAHEPQREGTVAWVRAGERKTCWTKPLPQVPGLWVFIGLGSFGSARDRGFPFSGLAPFGTPTGHSSCQRRPRLTLQPHIGTLTTRPAQASRPRSGGRFCFARFGRLVWAHDVSGTGWQTLGRAMQSITTMVPIWQ